MDRDGSPLVDAIVYAVERVDSNLELGEFLLKCYIMEQARSAGLPPDNIPDEFVELVWQNVLTLEVSTAKAAAFEKAIHKAANGDFCAAGRLIREHIKSGAEAEKYIPIGIKKSKQATEFGRRGSETSKRQGAENRQRVLDAAKDILSRRTRPPSSNRDWARLIAKEPGFAETPLAENTISAHLGKLKKAKLLD